MQTEQAAPPTNRPYPPPSNVIAIIARLRNRNLPEVVDTEYLRDASIPDGTNARTLFALRFLGLVSETGEPTAPLRSIATSTDEEYQATLARLIREAYAEVFVSVDPVQDGQGNIVNFFRRYTPASQRDRMVIFFLGICREAGIATLDVPRQRSSNASQGRKPTPRAAMPAASTPSAGNNSATPPAANLDPALDGLIRSLPAVGQAFPEPRRKQWLNMVEATLAFLYPKEQDIDNEDSEAVLDEI